MSSMGENEKRSKKYRKKRKKKGRKRKKKKGGPTFTGLQCSNNERFDGSGSELVYAPKGRGSLLFWLFFG